ncbi:NmrA domain-containing protein [Favolaschia claudopus]|uniref:NmrA domain-containing protein n=1 Tax=Favolaschia claudopus TaxID=2862362 RepID=A0AAW0AW21_9AGAR
MQLYSSFAVVGAGTIGLPILDALASQNVSILLLSRPDSPPKTVPSNVEVVPVNYDDTEAVAAVLKSHNVEVVLSTVGIPGLASQTTLVDAAKLAGVQLFSPSEYATPTDAQPPGSDNPAGGTGTKNKVAEYMNIVGLPSLRIFTGAFTEGIPSLFGEAPVSFTSIPDIAGFVAYILTRLPPSQLSNRIMRLQGERIPLNTLGTLFHTTVKHVDRIDGDGGELKTSLLKLLDSGAGSTGWDAANKREKTGDDAAGSGNKLWPGHDWRSIKEVLKL